MQENHSQPKTNESPILDGKAIFFRVSRYLLQYKLWILIAIIFLVILSITQVGIAAILKPIIDDGVVNKSSKAAFWLPIVMFLMMVVRSLVSYGSSYLMAKVGRSTIRDMRRDFFKKLVYLPSAYFDQVPSSTLVSKFIYDIEQTAVMMTDTLANLIRNSLTAIGLLGWMVFLDWRLCVIALFSVPLVAGVIRFANKKFRKASQEIQTSMGDIAEVVKENSLGQKVIKIYGAQTKQLDAFNAVNHDNYKKNMRRARVSSALVPVTTLCVAPIFAIILFIYLNYLVEGSDSAGKFVSFLGAMVMLMSPLKNLAKVNEKLQIGISAANSIFKVMDMPDETDNGQQNISSCRGDIGFNNVSFHYDSEDKRVINEVDFTVEAGQRVALVGSSGSGKSTVASLLMRFYDPVEGVINLDGVNIQDYKLADYRAMISVVNQDPVLFDNTIKYNITYGCDDIDENRLQQAMDAAYVSEFINELPEGLTTLVGEQGLRLSGGQRQRISIARAFYKNAPIIILDEATSALDVKSEQFIQQALETLMESKTSIVIAHRLSTIENADKIIVLQEGQIVETGSHAELMQKSGVYADFQKVLQVNEAEQNQTNSAEELI